MAVIVNEFEMVPAPPPAPAAALAAGEAKTGEGPKPKSAAETREVVRAVRHEWRRLARVQAD
jgi:hypothetical protein